MILNTFCKNLKFKVMKQLNKKTLEQTRLFRFVTAFTKILNIYNKMVGVGVIV